MVGRSLYETHYNSGNMNPLWFQLENVLEMTFYNRELPNGFTVHETTETLNSDAHTEFEFEQI